MVRLSEAYEKQKGENIVKPVIQSTALGERLSAGRTKSSPWQLWAAVSVAYLLIVSQRTAPGVISDYLLKDFHATGSMLGMISGLQFFVYMILQIPVGLWGDKFGPVRFLIFGVICDGVGTLLFSLAPHLGVLLVGRMMVGLGDAMIWVNCVLVLSLAFRSETFASALGWTGTMGSLGGMLTTMPLAWWVTQSGWRLPFSVMGMILLLHAMIMGWMFRRNPVTLPVVDRKPTDKAIAILREVLFQKRSWPPFLCHFGIVGTYAGFISLWAVPYLLDTYHLSRTIAAGIVGFGLIGASVSGPIAGIAADRMGEKRKPYVLFQGMNVLVWVSFLFVGVHSPRWIAYTLFFLLGFGSGGGMLTFASIRDTFPQNQVGVLSGLANTGGFLSAVLLPPFMGYMLDVFGMHEASSYRIAFLIPCLFAAIGLIGAWLLPRKKGSILSNV